MLWVLRQHLRFGALYLTHSRRFSELESYCMPKEEWFLQRDQSLSLMGTPIQAEVRLAEREAELLRFTDAVEELLNETDGDLREEKGVLVLSPIEADERSPQLKQEGQFPGDGRVETHLAHSSRAHQCLWTVSLQSRKCW